MIFFSMYYMIGPNQFHRKGGICVQDVDLINLFGNSCNEGMNQLISQYSGFVYTIVYSKISSVGTQEDAEECAADVFVEFYRSISSFDLSKGSVKAYLSIIAKRIAIARFHVLTKKKLNLISIDDEESPVKEICSEDESTELRDTLIEAIKLLGEPDCTIISKKYFNNETAKQIAAEIGMNSFSVQKRISRALKKLRKILKELGYSE